MQTALLPQAPRSIDHSAPPVGYPGASHAATLPVLPGQPGTHNQPFADISSAAGYDGDLEAGTMMEGPGLFTGLRVALLFNVFLGLAGLLAYEAWTALTY